MILSENLTASSVQKSRPQPQLAVAITQFCQNMIPAPIAQSINELMALDSSQAGRIIDDSEWLALPPAIQAIVPPWYRNLTSTFPVAGREYNIDEEGLCQGEIVFWEPAFFEGIHDHTEFHAAYGVDLTANAGMSPFCWLPDGEMLVCVGTDPDSAEVLHYASVFGLNKESALNCPLDTLLSRLIPSDYQGGVA